MKQDITAALKEMSHGLIWFSKEAFLLIYRVTLALAIFCVAVYLITHFFWFILGIAAIGFFVTWFYVEYKDAKSIREYEELIKSNEKV